MKYFLVILGLMAVVSAEFTVQTVDDLVKYRKECSEALNIPDEMVAKYKTWKFPEDKETNCYLKCVLTKMHLFDEAHGPNVDKLVIQLAHGRNADEVKTEVMKCIDHNEAGDDLCVYAARGFRCFIKNELPLVKHSLKKD